VCARVVYGMRISLAFGMLAAALSALLGGAMGALQGYKGGWVDLLGQRVTEIWASLPMLFVLITLAGVLKPHIGWLCLMVVVFGWMPTAGLVRAECLKTRSLDYVRAARGCGLSEMRIVLRHVLPNSVVSALTGLPFMVCGAITTLTALDFLGLGLPPEMPSLGELVAQGKANPTAPWLGLTGFAVFAVLLSLLFFAGEALRDGWKRA
jgi:microcin C transport system permease protein